MRFTQIAVALTSEGDESLYALGEDGVVYEKIGRVVRDPVTNARVHMAWWEPVNLPIGKPERMQ